MAPQLHFSLLLAFSLLFVSWAEVISLRSSNDSPQENNLLVPKAPRQQIRNLRGPQQAFNSPSSIGTHDIDDDLDLIDIILIASVDGKFHALNRTTGQTLWSMASFPASASVSAPSTLGPLIRTVHPTLDRDNFQEDLDDEDDEGDGVKSKEVYIIEPQSGDIYIMNPSTPTVPMQRFPFSMAELVDMSPFTFTPSTFETDEDGNQVETNYLGDKRIFVGRKETSLLLIELETGKIKATLNSECAWDDDEAIWDDIRRRNNNRSKRRYSDDEDEDEEDGRRYSYEGMIDLDDLEAPPLEKPTEVYIGRTDYHISIHTRPSPYYPDGSLRLHPRPTPPVQNLSFSVYGPNNKDNQLQAGYRRTKDGKYIQSLPNGEVMAFKVKNGRINNTPHEEFDQGQGPIMWAQNFENPIVAVFDVLRKPTPASPSYSYHTNRKSALVLLQPRAGLEDLLPGVTPQTKFPNSDAAYVGMVRETGSLFAMSPGKFPLVSFGGVGGALGGAPPRTGTVEDDGPEDPYLKEIGYRDAEDDMGAPPSADSITRARKHQERVQELVQWNRNKDTYCASPAKHGKGTKGETERRCLVGVRKVESEEAGNGRDSRLRRLIDPPREKDVKMLPWKETDESEISEEREMSNADEEDFSALNLRRPDGSLNTTALSDSPGRNGRWWWIMVLIASVVLGAVGVWSVVGARWLYWWKVESAQEMRGVPDSVQDVDLSASKSVAFVETVDETSKLPGHDTSKQSSDSVGGDFVVIPSQEEVTASPATPKTPGPLTDPPKTPVANVESPVGDQGDENAKKDAGDDAPASGEAPSTPKIKKTRRGNRGGKKKKPSQLNGNLAEGDDEDEKTPGNGQNGDEATPSSSSMVINTPKPVPTTPSLVVSENILGFGSHGTVVYKGSLQGRAVAVKRLLMDFTTLAQREVSILQESDDHPNVIRYYYQESHSNFLYIALELCPASLADIIENPDRDQWRDIAVAFEPKRALSQITSGLRHLHALKLVHRDIKPQNILVSSAKTGHGRGPGGSGGGYRMLISDFGLCKKLETDQTSFLPTANGAMGAGTVGWRAPEILRGEVKLDDLFSAPGSDDHSLSSRGSTSTVTSGSTPTTGKGTRLTKSVDIFALGCLFFYVLTNGGHPFGDRYEREVNILKGAKNLEALQRFGEEGTEAVNLIEQMLDPEASERPDTTTTLLHPYFWSPLRRLTFLQDASDRFEIMCRDPRDPLLIILEKGAKGVVGDDWLARLDKLFIENLGKFRKYDPKSVQDLLRALRNKKHHYQDMPDPLKRNMGPMPEGFLAYFTKRFPKLFMHVHSVIKDTSLSTESMFRSYFELTES